ncbi:MAG: TlpA disulfide reductase family protein [Verrucomicrobiota bacterium]
MLAVVALVGLTACTPNKEDKPPVPKATVDVKAGAATEPAALGTLPKIAAAPKWSLKDVDGKTVTSDDLKGKVVVVDFWATWCPPCRMEIPGYVELQKKYGKDGFVIVGASMDEGGPEAVKSFATSKGINYMMVMADEAVVAAFGGIEGLPTTFLIDRNGQIRDRKIGFEDHETYEKKVEAVLGEKA